MGVASLLWGLARRTAPLLWTLAAWMMRLSWAVARLMLAAGRVLTGKAGPRGRKISGNTAVRVRRHWNDHRVGTVRWSDLHDPRWDTVSGGTQVQTPHPFIHAYVWCNRVRGEIAHSCAHGPGPHNIKVCLVKKDNSKEVWDRVLGIVGPRPPRQLW